MPSPMIHAPGLNREQLDESLPEKGGIAFQLSTDLDQWDRDSVESEAESIHPKEDVSFESATLVVWVFPPVLDTAGKHDDEEGDPVVETQLLVYDDLDEEPYGEGSHVQLRFGSNQQETPDDPTEWITDRHLENTYEAGMDKLEEYLESRD